MEVRIFSKPYGERRVKTTWICDRCSRPFWTKYCQYCYCIIFPPHPKPFAVPYQKGKEWDRWHVLFYMMEPIEDPEEVYQIGSGELLDRIKMKEDYAKMVKCNQK